MLQQSSLHGRGIYAACDLAQGQRIIEYVGEKIGKAESNRRGWAQQERAAKRGGAAVYIFTLNQRHDIDGNVSGNIARFINHSCQPNCESQIIRGRIWVIALREIATDEELFFDYNFDLSDYLSHPCLCGTEACLGYIVGAEYRDKLRKLLAK